MHIYGSGVSRQVDFASTSRGILDSSWKSCRPPRARLRIREARLTRHGAKPEDCSALYRRCDSRLHSNQVPAERAEESNDRSLTEDPDFDIMSRVDTNRIDASFQADGFFRQAKTDAWRAMNAYTHSGLPQLVRQFSGTKVACSCSEQDVLEGLRAATASVLLLGYLLAKSTGQNDATGRWNSFSIRPPDHRQRAWQQLPRLSVGRPLPACS